MNGIIIIIIIIIIITQSLSTEFDQKVVHMVNESEANKEKASAEQTNESLARTAQVRKLIYSFRISFLHSKHTLSLIKLATTFGVFHT